MARTYYKDPIIDDILSNIPQRIQKEVDMFYAIAARINEILRRKGWNQANLAKAMGKKEAEISKWLSGSHNFTISTLARIETVLEEDIISVKKYRKSVSGYEQMPAAGRRWLSDNTDEQYGKKKLELHSDPAGEGDCAEGDC